MTGAVFHIDDVTVSNGNFRKVIHTAKGMQLVLMSLLPNEEIGMEVHEHVDQFFRIESGHGLFVLGNIGHRVKEGDAFIVDRGTCHNVMNTDDSEPMKLYTVYSPPNHPPHRIQFVKPEETKKELKASRRLMVKHSCKTR